MIPCMCCVCVRALPPQNAPASVVASGAYLIAIGDIVRYGLKDIRDSMCEQCRLDMSVITQVDGEFVS